MRKEIRHEQKKQTSREGKEAPALVRHAVEAERQVSLGRFRIPIMYGDYFDRSDY